MGISASSLWPQFCEKYLGHEPKKNQHTKISADKLSHALLQYAHNHHPEINLSHWDTVKKYAFHKVGRDCEKEVKLVVAHQIFEKYQRIISKLFMELTTERAFVKPARPHIPKGLSRLAIISSSILVEYLEPKYKANVQNLLHQVQKVKLAVKEFFDKDPHIDLDKITTLELLAKKLAYLNPKSGERFQFPYEGRMVEYEATELHLWMGMNAYGFKPVDENEKAPPVLVFSGTRVSLAQRGSLATVTADFDPRGVGFIAYKSGQKVISDWLKQTKGSALLTGHSLGGALARYAAIDNADLVKGAYTFSAPGISVKYGKKWEALNQSGQTKPFLYNFNHIEDKIPTLGQYEVGDNFQVITKVEKTVNQGLLVQRSIHNKRLFGKDISLLCKMHAKRSMPVWMQRALTIIPFIFFITTCFVNRALFGIYTSRPYVSLFGPIRWVWRKLMTEKLAAKYIQPQERLVAA